MASDLKLRAKEAFVDDNFELAAELYTQALDLAPDDADLYADRAQANIKLENYTGTCSDLLATSLSIFSRVIFHLLSDQAVMGLSILVSSCSFSRYLRIILVDPYFGP